MTDDDDQPDMFGSFTRARRGDPETSKLAAEKVAQRLNKLQQQVRDIMLAHSEGLTHWEIEHIYGWHGTTARTRVSELEQMGLVIKGPTPRFIKQSRDPTAPRGVYFAIEHARTKPWFNLITPIATQPVELRCAHCGDSGGNFEHVTHIGAPNGGVSVHAKCRSAYFQELDKRPFKY